MLLEDVQKQRLFSQPKVQATPFNWYVIIKGGSVIEDGPAFGDIKQMINLVASKARELKLDSDFDVVREPKAVYLMWLGNAHAVIGDKTALLQK